MFWFRIEKIIFSYALLSEAGDKNISILHLSCRTSHLQFSLVLQTHALVLYRRVAEIEIFEKTYLIVIKDETGLKFKMNDSTLFLIRSYAQKLVASY